LAQVAAHIKLESCESSMEGQAHGSCKADDEPEESHEAIWTSMSAVIVGGGTWGAAKPKQSVVEDSSDSECESGPAEDTRPEGRAATRRRRRPGRASDSDGSTSDSDSSAPCRVVDVAKGSVAAEDGITLADLLGGASLDMEELSSQPSAAIGVFAGDEGHMRLPSVERAQKQLQEIILRRSTINAISAKYSPASGVSRRSEKKDIIPHGPLRYPPAPPVMSKIVEATCSHEDAGAALRSPPGSPVAAPLSKEGPEAAESLRRVDRRLPDGAGPRSGRVYGPSARPDQAQVADVLRQLGAGLSGLGTRPKVLQGAVECSDPERVSVFAAASRRSSASEPAPTQADIANTLAGTGPARCTSTVNPSLDDFVSIVDVSDQGLAGARSAWGEDSAAPVACGAADVPVVGVASRYLVGDGDAREVGSCEGFRSRSATPYDGHPQVWPIDKEKFQAGRKREELRREELWLEFLAGNDDPVGGDLLPSPDSYHGCGPP